MQERVQNELKLANVIPGEVLFIAALKTLDPENTGAISLQKFGI